MGKTTGNYFKLRKKHGVLKKRYEALLQRARELEHELKESKKKDYDEIVKKLVSECEHFEDKIAIIRK